MRIFSLVLSFLFIFMAIGWLFLILLVKFPLLLFLPFGFFLFRGRNRRYRPFQSHFYNYYRTYQRRNNSQSTQGSRESTQSNQNGTNDKKKFELGDSLQDQNITDL